MFKSIAVYVCTSILSYNLQHTLINVYKSYTHHDAKSKRFCFATLCNFHIQSYCYYCTVTKLRRSLNFLWHSSISYVKFWNEMQFYRDHSMDYWIIFNGLSRWIILYNALVNVACQSPIKITSCIFNICIYIILPFKQYVILSLSRSTWIEFREIVRMHVCTCPHCPLHNKHTYT